MRKQNRLKAVIKPCFLLSVLFLSLVQENKASEAPPGSNNYPMQQSVTGKVTDANTGQPLGGATVSIKGSKKSTVTDAAGGYRIDAGSNAVLVFSFVGYAAQEISVNGNSVIDVALKPATGDLAQVVVMGYGSQSKKRCNRRCKICKK